MSELLASTAVLERTQQTTIDGTDSCEDCPDFNLDPPSESDCPHFAKSPDGKPICTNEGEAHRQQRLTKFWSGSGTADRSCSRLLK